MNVNTLKNIIKAIIVILFAIGIICLLAGINDDDALIVGGIITGTAIALWINYVLATYFYYVATEKGYYEVCYLWIPFAFTFVGYILVSALPDRKNIEKSNAESSNNDNSSAKTAKHKIIKEEKSTTSDAPKITIATFDKLKKGLLIVAAIGYPVYFYLQYSQAPKFLGVFLCALCIGFTLFPAFAKKHGVLLVFANIAFLFSIIIPKVYNVEPHYAQDRTMFPTIGLHIACVILALVFVLACLFGKHTSLKTKILLVGIVLLALFGILTCYFIGEWSRTLDYMRDRDIPVENYLLYLPSGLWPSIFTIFAMIRKTQKQEKSPEV